MRSIFAVLIAAPRYASRLEFKILAAAVVCSTGLQWPTPGLAGTTKKLLVTARVSPACRVVATPAASSAGTTAPGRGSDNTPAATFGMKCSKGTLWIPAVEDGVQFDSKGVAPPLHSVNEAAFPSDPTRPPGKSSFVGAGLGATVPATIVTVDGTAMPEKFQHALVSRHADSSGHMVTVTIYP